MKQVFESIGTKLIENPNFLHILTSEQKKDIGPSIIYFCTYSGSKLLNTTKNNIDYKATPFNLLYDPLTKYEDIPSEDTIHFLTNGLLIVYFVVLTYLISNSDYENISIANLLDSNFDNYTEIIGDVILSLYDKNKDNFLELFYNNLIIADITKILVKKGL